MQHVGYQQNTSLTSHEDVPRTELPTNERGLPTPEALSIVLRHAQGLLSGHTIAALSVNTILEHLFLLFTLYLFPFWIGILCLK